MTHQDKIQTVEALERMITIKGSANKVAAEMPGVSSATISQMRKHNWELISEEMWRKVAAYSGSSSNNWNHAETSTANELNHFFTDGQAHSLVMAITAKAGTGKSHLAKKV